MENSYLNVILTGSVAFDYLMSFPGRFREHIIPDKLDSISLSFLVESMKKRRGGTAPNIAYTMALLGQKPRLFATVGEDFEDYRDFLESKGVNTSLVRMIPEVNTASFFVNTDRDNNQIASFYPGAMAYAVELSLYDLEGEHPDLVIISPNDPNAMKRYARECQELFIPYLYDPSQQIVRLSGEDLQEGIEGAQSLFVNEYEFSMIQKKTGLSTRDLLDFVEFTVITRGEKGSTIYHEENEIDIPIFQPKLILDPTGVGDAYRGGFLTAMGYGWDWELCGLVGSLAATYCLEGEGPQSYTYTKAEFVARFRESFEDNGQLDILLSP
jgi:adenosine kinase